MADMYKLRPVLPNVNVCPNVPMYKLNSLHGTEHNSGNGAQGPVDPVVELEHSQKKLIEKLEQFRSQLDALLKSGTKQNSGMKSNTKADKKSERKAAKKEAIASKDQAKPVHPKPLPKETTSPLTVSLNANSASKVKANSGVITVHNYDLSLPLSFSCQLALQVADVKWLNGLVKLGKARKIQIGAKATGPNSISIKTSKSDVQLVGLTKHAVKGRVAVWKAVGSLVHAYDPLDSLASLEANKWLQLADDFLSGCITFDDFYRPLNRRLNEVDFLCGNTVLLVDIVLAGLVAGHTVASNVECWSSRVNQAL